MRQSTSSTFGLNEILSEISLLSFLAAFLLSFRYILPETQVSLTIFVGAIFYAMLRIHVLPTLSRDPNTQITHLKKDCLQKQQYTHLAKKPKEAMCAMPLDKKNKLITKLSTLKNTYQKTLRQLSETNQALQREKHQHYEQNVFVKKVEREKCELLQQISESITERKILEEKNSKLQETVHALKQRLSAETEMIQKLRYENTQFSIEKNTHERDWAKLNKKLATLAKKMALLDSSNAELKQVNQECLTKKTKWRCQMSALKQTISTLQTSANETLESVEQNTKKTTYLLSQLHQQQQYFSTNVEKLLNLNHEKLKIVTEQLEATQQNHLKNLTDLNQKLQTALETCLCQQLICYPQRTTPTSILQSNVNQLIEAMLGLKTQIDELKVKQKKHHEALQQLVNTRILPLEKPTLTLPGYLWELTTKNGEEIRPLLNDNTVVVGSFMVYLLCQQYGIATIGFEEVDIDLITRLKPSLWQKQFEELGGKVIQLWNNHGITACKALFRGRKLDVVFVDVDPTLHWSTWLNTDVDIRPDNSIASFYGVKQENKLIAYDPSGEGMLSLLTNSIRILGNGKKAIQAKLRDNPIRILRLANMAAKFGLTIEPCTFNVIIQLSQDLTFAQSIQRDWILAKHQKYLRSCVGKYYQTMLSTLDPNNSLFSTSHFFNKSPSHTINANVCQAYCTTSNDSHTINPSLESGASSDECSRCNAIELQW